MLKQAGTISFSLGWRLTGGKKGPADEGHLFPPPDFSEDHHLRGLWGRFLSQVNHPEAPELLSVDRRIFLAGLLQKPVFSEHPQRSDSSGVLWSLCPPAFSASWPPNTLCASSHHQELLPEPLVPSLTLFTPLRMSTHPCRQRPLWHQPPLSA